VKNLTGEHFDIKRRNCASMLRSASALAARPGTAPEVHGYGTFKINLEGALREIPVRHDLDAWLRQYPGRRRRHGPKTTTCPSSARPTAIGALLDVADVVQDQQFGGIEPAQQAR
jgi:hypothetical protein